MIHTLLVVDEALPTPIFDFWQDHAHQVEYGEYGHIDGHKYKNVGFPPEGKSLMKHIERAIGQTIKLHYEFLRFGEPGDGAGNIHCDNGDAEMASVLYLNTENELFAHPHGTAFWIYKEFSIDRLPAGMDPELVDAINAHRTAWGEWDQNFVIPAVANRLIVYPSNVFHSRWPLEPAAGRLVHVAFFDLVGP